MGCKLRASDVEVSFNLTDGHLPAWTMDVVDGRRFAVAGDVVGGVGVCAGLASRWGMVGEGPIFLFGLTPCLRRMEPCLSVD